MKKSVLVFLLLIILIAGGIYLYQQNHVVTAPTTQQIIPSPSTKPKPSPTLAQTSYCTTDALDPRVSLETAAGNTYANISLKNISGKTCSIDGNNFILPTSSAANVTITKEGKEGPQYITLAPDQTVYSQVHYPNGPQCTSETETYAITFAYKISPSQTITFFDKDSNPDLSLTGCKSEEEKTPIQVWSISETSLD